MTSVGFRVKSGWATAVLLGGAPRAVRVLDRRRVELSDPADPDLRQPYHADFGVEQSDTATVRARVRAIERFSSRSLANLFEEYERSGHRLGSAAIVVGSDIDPDKIANQHIRAHAREGRLFRRVLEEAVTRQGLPCSIQVERTLYAVGAKELRQSEERIKRAAAGLGREVAGGWRSDDKTAAVAAWLAMARAPRSGRSASHYRMLRSRRDA